MVCSMGQRCYCSPGFQLHNSGVSCVDEDECRKGTARCKHSCLNVIGSYVCRCYPGFLLDPDKRSCKTRGGTPLLLYRVCVEDASGYRVCIKAPSGYRVCMEMSPGYRVCMEESPG